jgi:hypothetical protein
VKFSLKEPFELGKILNLKHKNFDIILPPDEYDQESIVLKTSSIGNLKLKNVY